MIKAFPKIFAIGQDYIIDLFKDEVEVTEKIDGSQFNFGKVDGILYMRSKGQQIYLEQYQKLFTEAVEYVTSIEKKIPDNTIYYCEYLQKPKHNALTYDRVPKNHLILFGISNPGDKFISKYEELKKYADEIDIETVPLLYRGKVATVERIIELLGTQSILGGSKIEGVVAKNYSLPFLLGGQPIPVMCGKYVSEEFKEVHKIGWNKEHTGRGRFEIFKLSFRTEARWEKAIQHLRDNGELENSPRDIGKLMKEVNLDITKENKQEIMDFLWKEFGKSILGAACRGLPEYYKNKLLENSFEPELVV